MAVWIDKFITPNAYSRPQQKLTAVKKLVIHYTANNGGTAMNHYNYFNTQRSTYASAHIFVDKTEAICIIPLNEVAYHANDVQRRNADGSAWRGVAELKPNANYLSVGVEMCVERDGTFHPQTVARAEDVMVELCKKFGLDPIKDIVRHRDVTYKECPAPWVANGQLFIDFKNRVNAKFKGVNASQPAKPIVFPSGAVGLVTILVEGLRVRDTYSTSGNIVKKELKVGDKYFAYKEVNGWYLITTGEWIYGNNGEYVSFIEAPKPTPTPAPVEHMYRVRKTWDDVKGQVGAYKELENAKDLADKNVGYSVFDENGKVVYTPAVKEDPKPTPQPQPEPQPVEPAPEQPKQPEIQPEQKPEPTVDPHECHHNILGEPTVDYEKMVAFVKAVNPKAQDIEEIALNFIEVSRKYGIRGDMAFCQSIIETGYFKFDCGTAVTPDQHNYCGMGVTSKGVKGNCFASIKDGVTAQMQHLFAYASKDAIPNGDAILDPRFQYVARGTAQHWEDLNNCWAMNDHYGHDIVALYDKLVNFEYVKPEAPTVDEAQVNMAKNLIDYFVDKIKGLFGK